MKIIRDICPKLKESVEINMGQCTNKNFIIKISTNVDEEIGAIIIIAQLFEHRQVCNVCFPALISFRESYINILTLYE